MHKSAQECIAFKSRFKASIYNVKDTTKPLLVKVITGNTSDMDAEVEETMNAALFYMLVEKIGDDSLVGTISDRFLLLVVERK